MLTFIIATLCFVVLDALWLGVVGTQFYVQGFGHMMTIVDGSIKPNWPAAIIVYIALIVGILCFVIPKADGHVVVALLWGALFGFVTYATYDFTNLAVLSDWPWKISIIDTCWGIVLCATTSAVTVWLTRLLN